MLPYTYRRNIAVAEQFGSQALSAATNRKSVPEILTLAAREIGIAAVVTATVQAENWYWAYSAIRHLNDELTSEQRSRLAATVAKANNSHAALLTLREGWLLPQEDKAMLRNIMERQH